MPKIVEVSELQPSKLLAVPLETKRGRNAKPCDASAWTEVQEHVLGTEPREAASELVGSVGYAVHQKATATNTGACTRRQTPFDTDVFFKDTDKAKSDTRCGSPRNSVAREVHPVTW